MKKITGLVLLMFAQVYLTKAQKFTEPSEDAYIDNVRKTDRAAYSTIIRKSRQTDSNGTLMQGTDSLTSQISKFSENFRKEVSNHTHSINKITNLENEIQKVKDELKILKNAPNVDSSSKTKYASLESAMETLQKLLDDNRKLSESEMKKFESTIDILTTSLGNYRSELEKLKTLMDEKEKAEKEKGIPAEIALDIKDNQVHLAASKYLKLKGDFQRHAAHVIRAVNIKQGNGFKLLIDFVRVMHGNSEIIRQFYEALRAEMESVHFDDVIQYLNLIASVRFTIVNNNWDDDVPEAVKRSARVYVEDRLGEVKDIAARKLADAMIGNDYDSRSVMAICNATHEDDADPLLFRDIIKRTVNSVVDRMDSLKILNFLKKHIYISQHVFGFSALFDALKARNRSNDPVIPFLAWAVNDVTRMDNYPNSLPEAKAVVEEIKGALAKSVRNLAFARRVCIRNKQLDLRMHAGDWQSFDESRRRVFTSVRDTPRDRDGWYIFPYEDVFYIYNFDVKEYLYAADDNHKLDMSRRRVLTWMPGDMVTQGKWIIEPSGDDIYIKNVVHNEYLYTDEFWSNHERSVFTWGSGSKPERSLWTVVNCTSR